MAHNDDKQPSNGYIKLEELADARALLQDPAQVAAVDTQNFGRRLSEIVLRALRRKPRKNRT